MHVPPLMFLNSSNGNYEFCHHFMLERVQLIKLGTLGFIASYIWPTNISDISHVDYVQNLEADA